MTFMPNIRPAQTQADVDMRFELWHSLSDEEFEALGKPSINDYLGWSDEDYWAWVMKGIIP